MWMPFSRCRSARPRWLRFRIRTAPENFALKLDFDNSPQDCPHHPALPGRPPASHWHHGPRRRRLPGCYTRYEIIEDDFLVEPAYHRLHYHRRCSRRWGRALASGPCLMVPRPADCTLSNDCPNSPTCRRAGPGCMVRASRQSQRRRCVARQSSPKFATCPTNRRYRKRNTGGRPSRASHRELNPSTHADTRRLPAADARGATTRRTFLPVLICCRFRHDSGPDASGRSRRHPRRGTLWRFTQNLANWPLRPPPHRAPAAAALRELRFHRAFAGPDEPYFNHCVRNIAKPDVLAALRAQLRPAGT